MLSNRLVLDAQHYGGEAMSGLARRFAALIGTANGGLLLVLDAREQILKIGKMAPVMASLSNIDY